MGRAFGLLSIVCALAFAGMLGALKMQKDGPASSQVQRAKQEANAAVAAIDFTAAATELEAFRAENATYAGASLPPAFGVTLVRADAASYCLQAGAGTSLRHVTGPGGSAAAGSC